MIYDDGLLTCVRREALPSTSILSYNLCCFLLKFHYNAVLNPLHPESLSQTVSFCCFPQTIFMPLSNDGFGSSVAFLLRSAGCSFTLHQSSLSDGAADDLSSHIQNALAVISAESPFVSYLSSMLSQWTVHAMCTSAQSCVGIWIVATGTC